MSEDGLGWWYRATKAQRLAQIDGGIELGLSARQIAFVSGVPRDLWRNVHGFANRHGRHFGVEHQTDKARKSSARGRKVVDLKRAYFNGEYDFTDNADHSASTDFEEAN